MGRRGRWGGGDAGWDLKLQPLTPLDFKGRQIRAEVPAQSVTLGKSLDLSGPDVLPHL